jgi:Uma2 family endonuclease
MSTATKGFTVDQYDELVANGILPETNRFELINGKLVEKDVKPPPHCTATDRTRKGVERLLPSGWFVRQEAPVRIPNRKSELEPDLSVVRGGIDDTIHQRIPNDVRVARMSSTRGNTFDVLYIWRLSYCLRR